MHDYVYDSMRVVCTIMSYDYGICMHYYSYALVWPFYIKMCIGHAKIIVFSTLVSYEKTSATEENSPVYHSYLLVYRSEPIV
jgi:hypothetical protein